MTNRTVLHDRHTGAGARMVDFGGWDMPVNYGSQIEEHNAVRTASGMFDVSHMTVVDFRGERVRDYLRYLLANDVASLTQPGKALYTCMLTEAGGVIDDLITYYMSDTWYRLVVNAATRERDLAWLQQHTERFGVELTERDDLAMIAVQGPQARKLAAPLLGDAGDAAYALKPFYALDHAPWFVARTGYTGEDGWEIILPADRAGDLWDQLAAAGVRPCGLGARDTLRLEAGLNLYGNDMDDTVTPLQSGLEWTVAWEPSDRDFCGRAALEAQRDKGVPDKLVGLILEERGVLRAHQPVIVEGIGEGQVTSGTYSPTLECSIGLARVPAATGDRCSVRIRGKDLKCSVHRPPFVRKGKILITR